MSSIVERYLAVWNEPDPVARKQAVTELWTEDGVEYVEGKQFRGHDGLVERVAEAHERFVASDGYRITHDGSTTPSEDVVVLTVRLTRPDGGTDWAARVFLLLDADGRIREDYHLTVQPLPPS
ncbi:nuclear transport factor 2 family protein [Streptacidiphilus pinicola]|uniref:Nuclear transport factor 2 family protein n=1 Tax=Streptacidiphilus pinicola TaxID=2219663 RepID=A0A2X0ICS6_9ACTN|nr:nuclear transport factor 2 family protein [Streptacidiphilus pinicola]RAG82307.1 nuclear transport factor 2 family protein [Streptacidiphilus pinicola]